MVEGNVISYHLLPPPYLTFVKLDPKICTGHPPVYSGSSRSETRYSTYPISFKLAGQEAMGHFLRARQAWYPFSYLWSVSTLDTLIF